MPNIPIVAAAAAIAVFAVISTSTSASAQAAPLRLSQFMTPGGAPAAKHHAKTHTGASKPRLAAKSAPRRTAVADVMPLPAAAVTPVAAKKLHAPEGIVETDGVAITSADEVNEIDTAADTVQVVAANEVNDIDLAADTAAPATPSTTVATTAQAVAVETAPADRPATDPSWIGRVFLALGGVLAIASAARLLIA
jgi:hypothetical protein